MSRYPDTLATARLTLRLEAPASVLARIDAMAPDARAQVSPRWLARVRALTAPDPWTCGFSAELRDSGVMVGSCGFKDPPSLDGVVEIAYGVEPAHRGLGFATEMAAALTAFAFDDSRVHLVCAHTLADGHASIRVLTKCGFTPVGDVLDPEDGLVLRFEIRRAESR